MSDRCHFVQSLRSKDLRSITRVKSVEIKWKLTLTLWRWSFAFAFYFHTTFSLSVFPSFFFLFSSSSPLFISNFSYEKNDFLSVFYFSFHIAPWCLRRVTRTRTPHTFDVSSPSSYFSPLPCPYALCTILPSSPPPPSPPYPGRTLALSPPCCHITFATAIYTLLQSLTHSPWPRLLSLSLFHPVLISAFSPSLLL